MPNVMKRKKTTLMLLVLAVMASYLTVAALNTSEGLQALDPLMIDAGSRHFAAHCAHCHGADGKGGERGPDIISTQRARRRTAGELTELIRNGIPTNGMPAFRLPERELQELTAFLRSRSAPAVESTVAGNVALLFRATSEAFT